MADFEKESGEIPAFDPYAQARAYGEYYEIAQNEEESDDAYRSRVAGELRRRGNIVEAHEAASGRRWDDPEQGPAGPLAGITGAMAQALAGFEYSPGNPERQIGDDVAAGIVATAGTDLAQQAIGALFDILGPEKGMDVIDAFTRSDRRD